MSLVRWLAKLVPRRPQRSLRANKPIPQFCTETLMVTHGPCTIRIWMADASIVTSHSYDRTFMTSKCGIPQSHATLPSATMVPGPFAPNMCPRLVIKIGSSLLVDRQGQLRLAWLASLLDDVSAHIHAGQQIAIVTSGAIALGARMLGLRRGGRASLDDAQAAAAVGQIALGQAYAGLLRERNHLAAQLLLTLDDLEDRRRYLNASATLERLFRLGAVPIINENDSVATAEIRFGDNDRLAARAAQAMSATGIILLSDVDGLYTADPASDPGAKYIQIVEDLDVAEPMASAASRSGIGSGGMRSKLLAARMSRQAGIPLVIAPGKFNNPIAALVSTGVGTLVPAVGLAANGKKGWLAGRLTVAGSIQVDEGAEAAIQTGKSLLPSGVMAVSGEFEAGSVVEIAGSKPFARGLVNYNSRDACLVMGKRSNQLEACLGYPPRSTFIHANHLVLM